MLTKEFFPFCHTCWRSLFQQWQGHSLLHRHWWPSHSLWCWHWLWSPSQRCWHQRAISTPPLSLAWQFFSTTTSIYVACNLIFTVISTTTPSLTIYVSNNAGSCITTSRDIHKLKDTMVDWFITHHMDADHGSLLTSTLFAGILSVTAHMRIQPLLLPSVVTGFYATKFILGTTSNNPLIPALACTIPLILEILLVAIPASTCFKLLCREDVWYN